MTTVTHNRNGIEKLSWDQFCAKFPKESNAAEPPTKTPLTCQHGGKATGETVPCKSCQGIVKIKVFQCSEHGDVVVIDGLGLHSCQGCHDFQPKPATIPAPQGMEI